MFNNAVNNEESRTFDGATPSSTTIRLADFRSSTTYRQFETVNLEDEDGTDSIPHSTSTPRTSRTTRASTRSSSSRARPARSTGSRRELLLRGRAAASDTHTYTDGIDTALVNLASCRHPDGPLFGVHLRRSWQANGIPLSLLGHVLARAMYNEGEFEAVAAFGDVIWHATDS